MKLREEIGAMRSNLSHYGDTMTDIAEHTAFRLANDADCMCPDTSESAGASFLTRVRDDVLERVEDITAEDFGRETEDIGHEVADSAVPIYTYAKWQTFVDLGAWQTDVFDFVGGTEDLDQLGSIALYEIARTLVDSILSELTEAIREDDDEL